MSDEFTPMTDGPKTLADAIDAVEEAYEFMLAYAAQGRAREEGGDDGVRGYLRRAEAGLAIIASSRAWTVARHAKAMRRMSSRSGGRLGSEAATRAATA